MPPAPRSSSKYFLLPKDDPLSAVKILQAAAGVDSPAEPSEFELAPGNGYPPGET